MDRSLLLTEVIVMVVGQTLPMSALSKVRGQVSRFRVSLSLTHSLRVEVCESSLL